LITSLAQYSESHQQDTIQIEDHKPSISEAYEKSKLTYDDVSSLLFLRIHAVADYYTRNETLMKHVPPVFVDIILDPYVFNVFPRSLVPTAAYIIILAIGGWYLAKYISESVKDFSKYDFDMEKKIT
jgi:hypothetical protein